METKHANIDQRRLFEYVRVADAISTELREASANIREIRKNLGEVKVRAARLEDHYGRWRGDPPPDLLRARAAVNEVEQVLAIALADHAKIHARRDQAQSLAGRAVEFARSQGVSVDRGSDLPRSVVRT